MQNYEEVRDALRIVTVVVLIINAIGCLWGFSRRSKPAIRPAWYLELYRDGNDSQMRWRFYENESKANPDPKQGLDWREYADAD